MPVCPQCQRDRLGNNGSVASTPHKLCQPWGEQFPRTTPRGQPLAMKVPAVLWSLRGLSMPRLAFLLRVSAPSVRNGLRPFAPAHDEQPESPGNARLLALDERGHDLKHTRRKRWSWTALEAETGQLRDWAGGRRDKTPRKKRVKRLAQGDVKLSCTAPGAAYASVIPQDQLVQQKTTTHDIERHPCRQRHWCGRVKRQSIIVSTSTERGALTMALFATCWGNGNQDELLSRLG